MASSAKYSSSLHEIETLWSIDDVIDANAVLDLYDEAERRAIQEAERKTGR